VVAAKGVSITIRVLDPKQFLINNPKLDDLRIGAYSGKTFIPALLGVRDFGGKTMTLVVPTGQALNIAVSSSKYALADALGNAFAAGETLISVPSAAIVTATNTLSPAPAVTVQVTASK